MNKLFRIGLVLPVLVFFGAAALPALEHQKAIVFFHEDFRDLGSWKPFYFPKISRHSVYSIERSDGRSFLKAESHASASAIVYNKPFNVRDFPRARWRWKVSNVYVKGDPRTKAGDDYPIRIYIMFEYDPAAAGFFKKMQYAYAKTVYGEYPPDSSLSYVWANKEDPERVITSPYTDRAKMVLLEKGAQKVRMWQDEEVDMVEDYRKAFGSDPPSRARLAIMNDSDNTGESSVSYVEYIEVFK